MLRCSAPDCIRYAIAKGLCMMHYARLRRYGRISLVKKKPAHADESLIQRLEDQSIPVPECGCRIWLHQTNGRYGMLTYKNKTMFAHRASWETHYGPVPKGMNVLHRCDTPSCINPHHLFLGTQCDNMQDAIKKGRFKGRKKVFAAILSITIFIASLSGVGGREKEVNTMKLDDLTVRMAGNKLLISGDPKVLSDICNILGTLTDLTRYLKKRTEHIQAQKRATDPIDRAQREAAFNTRSKDVFCVYRKHLENGCGGNKALALKTTRQELGLMACDTKILVMQGRKLAREKRG